MSVALSPRTGDSGVRFREGPAPNAFLMQTGAQAACWAPPSPPAPAAPASPPGRPWARRFLLLLPLPFPGPALAEVLTAGSRGRGGAQMGLLSPPAPSPRPCLAALAGLGWLAQLRDGVESGGFPGLRQSQGVGDTMTGGLQIPQATFSAKVTEARGETQQRGQAVKSRSRPPLLPDVPCPLPQHRCLSLRDSLRAHSPPSSLNKARHGVAAGLHPVKTIDQCVSEATPARSTRTCLGI